MRIGIFDSGIGGINVLSCLIKRFPNNHYIYFGDTKNLPYGDKKKEELMKLACAAIDFLLSKKVDMIIIACGTISSNCYEDLKKKYDIPLYDIISPTVNYLNNCDYSKIGVIGTKRTIESNIFKVPNKDVLMKETPSFVPIIENNRIKEKEKDILQELNDFKEYPILVLGCTHYPLLKELINEKLKIDTLDMGEILINDIKISNNNHPAYELYFSLISVNLLNNISAILDCDYQIYLK